jgi:hypothetical protein
MRFPTFVMGPSLTAQHVARFRPAKTNSAISSPSVGLSPNENRSRAREFILLSTLILAKIRLTEPCLNSHPHSDAPYGDGPALIIVFFGSRPSSERPVRVESIVTISL